MTSLPLPGFDAAKQMGWKNRFKLPLRLVLIGLFVLLTVGTVGAVEYLCFRNGQQAAENLASQLMQNVSGRVELYLTTYLQTPQLVNQLNANAGLLGELDLQDLPGVEQHLFTQLKQFESISSIQVGNAQQDFRAITRQDGLRLLQANAVEPTRIEEYQLDSRGRKTQLLSTSQQTSVRNQLWYQAALFAGKPTWGPISQLSNAEDSSLTAIQPVYDSQGQVSGVFSTAILLNSIGDFLHHLPVGKSGEVFIIEQDGWTVATSDRALSENRSRVDRFNLIDSSAAIEQTAARSLIDRFGDFSYIDNPQQLAFSQHGDRHFLQIMPFHDGDGLDWLIGVMVPEADFMEQIHIDTRMTLLLCAAVLTASVLSGLWAAGCMTRSIERLSQASRSLAQGKWDESLQQDSPIAELQVLTDAFNQTAIHLQQSFDRVNIALRESEEKFTHVFRACPDAIGIATLDGRCVDVNDAFFDQLGYSREEVMGQDATQIGYWVNLDDRQRYLAALQAGEPVRNWELVVRHKNGTRLTVLFSADMIELQGQPHIIAVTTNISDRKQAELALQQQKELRETIYNESADALFLVDPETLRIVDCNRRAVELFEADSKLDLMGIEGRTLQRRSFTPAEIDQIVAEMGEKGFWTQEVEYITRKGKVFWGNLAAKPVQIADQSVHLVRVTDITDRKQSEAALRQSEARFQRLAAAAPGAIYTLVKCPDQSFYFEYVSPAIEEINELTVEQMLNEPALNLIHPDDQAGYEAAVAYSAITLQAFSHEFRIITPSGQLKWLQASSRPERRQNGEIAWYGIVLDVSDRHQAETALRQSEATKNQILKAIPDLIIWMTADGTCIDFMDGSSVTNLYKKSEAIGKNLYDLLPLELAQARINAVQQALRTGEVQIYEQQLLIQDNVCYEEVRVIGVGGDRILVIVRDITKRKRSEAERKRAEAALLDSETRFRSAFQDAPIGMALIGLDDRWLKVNPMLCEMLGCSEPELLSMTVSSLVHPEEINQFQQCIQQVLSSENPAQVELRYCCHPGHLVWGLMSLSLVRHAQGQPLYYVAQIQDITERQAIDRMKNEFISIVSHELRTPLTAIRGFLGLLDTGIYNDKPDRVRHMIGQALTNSDRLVRLVNDILDLERLSSGRAQFVMQTCEAENLMRQAAAGVQSIADQAPVALVIIDTGGHTTARVWADPDTIMQTLTNLLSNAIKFSPPHSVITLSAQAQSEWVLFSVTDQGRGIPTDKLETIFGRFQQVDVSDARQKGGTGLGLAICQSIVQQHGGNIWAESRFGAGSTFYFTLPFPPGGEHD